MGLDQYWFAVDADETPETVEPLEIHYHRKVPALQGFMEDLAREKLGITDINCRNIPITEQDLDDLEELANKEELPEDTTGFFYGSHRVEDYADILNAVRKARKYIYDGNKVFYSCWY